jgi:hypothetical protein
MQGNRKLTTCAFQNGSTLHSLLHALNQLLHARYHYMCSTHHATNYTSLSFLIINDCVHVRSNFSAKKLNCTQCSNNIMKPNKLVTFQCRISTHTVNKLWLRVSPHTFISIQWATQAHTTTPKTRISFHEEIISS